MACRRCSRTASVADLYCQLRVGGDIAFLGGIINYAMLVIWAWLVLLAPNFLRWFGSWFRLPAEQLLDLLDELRERRAAGQKHEAQREGRQPGEPHRCTPGEIKSGAHVRGPAKGY